MRYITIILCAMLLGSCGRLGTLKYAGEKVKETVNVCTQTIDGKDIDLDCPSVGTQVQRKQPKEDIETKPSASWDTHMMLW